MYVASAESVQQMERAYSRWREHAADGESMQQMERACSICYKVASLFLVIQ